jgi:hypothetical protein
MEKVTLAQDDLSKCLLVSYEAQIQVAVIAASFSHLLDSLPSLHLGLVANTVFHVFPFPQKFMHLQVIENGLSERVDPAEQRERSPGVGGNQGVENDPFAALAKIVFEFNYQRHTGPVSQFLGMVTKRGLAS